MERAVKNREREKKIRCLDKMGRNDVHCYCCRRRRRHGSKKHQYPRPMAKVCMVNAKSGFT